MPLSQDASMSGAPKVNIARLPDDAPIPYSWYLSAMQKLAKRHFTQQRDRELKKDRRT
jgi:hypothetical protein